MSATSFLNSPIPRLLLLHQIEEVQAVHRQVHRDGQRLRVAGRPRDQPQQRGGAAAPRAALRLAQQGRRGVLERARQADARQREPRRRADAGWQQ